jgi:hypothetical protein
MTELFCSNNNKKLVRRWICGIVHIAIANVPVMFPNCKYASKLYGYLYLTCIKDATLVDQLPFCSHLAIGEPDPDQRN